MKQTHNLEEVLNSALAELQKTNSANPLAGACIYTPPSGRPQCFQMTPQQCAAIKGVYVGGPCSNTELDINKPIGKSDAADSPIVDKEYSTDADADCTCTYQQQSYAQGAIVCMGGKQYKCGCGGWFNTEVNC